MSTHNGEPDFLLTDIVKFYLGYTGEFAIETL